MKQSWKSVPEKRLGCFCFNRFFGSHMCLTGGVIFCRLNQWYNLVFLPLPSLNIGLSESDCLGLLYLEHASIVHEH